MLKTYLPLAATVVLSLLSTSMFADPGWQTLKGAAGSCQLSIPGNWSLLSVPGHAASPEHMGTTVIEGRAPFHQFQFSAGMQKVLNIATVFENSPQRVFYVAKADDLAGSLIYHVEAPGRTKACIAEITTSASYSPDEVKKIPATLTAVK
jgi:hypothetical protein